MEHFVGSIATFLGSFIERAVMIAQHRPRTDLAVLGGLAAVLLAIGTYVLQDRGVAADQMTDLVTSP